MTRDLRVLSGKGEVRLIGEDVTSGTGLTAGNFGTNVDFIYIHTYLHKYLKDEACPAHPLQLSDLPIFHSETHLTR